MTVSIAHALMADRVWMVSIITRAAAWRDTLGTTAKKVKFMSNLLVLNAQSPVLETERPFCCKNDLVGVASFKYLVLSTKLIM